MSDPAKHSEEKRPGGDKRPRPKNTRAVSRYLVILFVAAFVLLIMAYLMQERSAAAQQTALPLFDYFNTII